MSLGDVTAGPAAAKTEAEAEATPVKAKSEAKAQVNAQAPAQPHLPWRLYLCRVCGLVYDEARGDSDSGLAPGTRFEDIPDDWACPICGVGKADFELHRPATRALRTARVAPAPLGAGVARQGLGRGAAGVVIVGAGRAGWQLAQCLREHDPGLPLTLVSACAGDVYDKPLLSVAVARGLALNALVRESAAQAAARLNLRLLSHTHALRIDSASHCLRTSRGTLRYSHLALAMGAEPALPAVLPASLTWRVNDLAAYQRLRAALGHGLQTSQEAVPGDVSPRGGPQRVAVVGAGLVGCELANDLALAGHHITLLDTQSHPLAALLPAAAAAALLQAWQGLPICFLGGVQVTSVARLANVVNMASEASEAGVERPLPAQVGAARLLLSLADGRSIEVDHLVAATGLRTASRLARSAGLAFDPIAGGIEVKELTGATSQPGIYALGDCVVVNGHASRYIEPIGRQALAIAGAILGQAQSSRSSATAATATTTSPALPVLRVKTSAMPITVTGSLGGSGRWEPEPTGSTAGHELRLRRLGPDGEVLARLVARRADAIQQAEAPSFAPDS